MSSSFSLTFTYTDLYYYFCLELSNIFYSILKSQFNQVILENKYEIV